MRPNDLPPGVEHISQISPRVLNDITRRATKKALVDGACRRILSNKMVQHVFDHFKELRGHNDS